MADEYPEEWPVGSPLSPGLSDRYEIRSGVLVAADRIGKIHFVGAELANPEYFPLVLLTNVMPPNRFVFTFTDGEFVWGWQTLGPNDFHLESWYSFRARYDYLPAPYGYEVGRIIGELFSGLFE